MKITQGPSPPPSPHFSLRIHAPSRTLTTNQPGLTGARPYSVCSIRASSVKSGSLPLRIALLEERPHALLNILGGEGDRELRADEVERLEERHVELAEHRVLAQAHH